MKNFSRVSVVVIACIIIPLCAVVAQQTRPWRAGREVVDIDRLRRTYDAEFGIVCYHNIYGNNQTPFCLYAR